MRECEECCIKHASPEEATEVHAATASIHQWLKERMLLVTNPVAIEVPPTKPKELRPNPVIVKRHNPGFGGKGGSV